MKASRQAKILELIGKYQIETQEELSAHLEEEGYPVTQATISRDIRELKLTKVAMNNGKQQYAVLGEQKEEMAQKYSRVFRDGFRSIDMAQNILVIKTMPGMAMAVAASIDAMDRHEIVGSIAGDDTVMCAIRSVEETRLLMKQLRKIVDSEG